LNYSKQIERPIWASENRQPSLTFASCWKVRGAAGAEAAATERAGAPPPANVCIGRENFTHPLHPLALLCAYAAV